MKAFEIAVLHEVPVPPLVYLFFLIPSPVCSLILCVSTAQRSHEVHCGPGDSLMDRNLVTQDLAPIPWSIALWKWNMYPEGLGEVHFCKEKGRIMQIKVLSPCCVCSRPLQNLSHPPSLASSFLCSSSADRLCSPPIIHPTSSPQGLDALLAACKTSPASHCID